MSEETITLDKNKLLQTISVMQLQLATFLAEHKQIVSKEGIIIQQPQLITQWNFGKLLDSLMDNFKWIIEEINKNNLPKTG